MPKVAGHESKRKSSVRPSAQRPNAIRGGSAPFDLTFRAVVGFDAGTDDNLSGNLTVTP